MTWGWKSPTDPDGGNRYLNYCARPPFALDRLHLVGNRSDQILYILPRPDLAGRTALRLSALEFLDRLATILPPPRIHRHSYHGVFAPNAPLRPLVTERARKDNALAAEVPGPSLPLPTPPTTPAPQTELAMRPGGGQADEVAQESFPDDLDQSPKFDPAEPEPIPEDVFDQGWEA